MVEENKTGFVLGSNGHDEEAYKKLQSLIENPPDMIGAAFSTPEIANALKMLVDPGKDIQNILMRANFEDRPHLVSFLNVMVKDSKFGYTEGTKELLAYAAGLCSIDNGKRASMLVDAIIGNNHQRAQESFWGKFKNASGLGEK